MASALLRDFLPRTLGNFEISVRTKRFPTLRNPVFIKSPLLASHVFCVFGCLGGVAGLILSAISVRGSAHIRDPQHHVNHAALQNHSKHNYHGATAPKVPTKRALAQWHEAAAAHFSQAGQQSYEQRCFINAPFRSSAKASPVLQGASLCSPEEKEGADARACKDRASFPAANHHCPLLQEDPSGLWRRNPAFETAAKTKTTTATRGTRRCPCSYPSSQTPAYLYCSNPQEKTRLSCC